VAVPRHARPGWRTAGLLVVAVGLTAFLFYALFPRAEERHPQVEVRFPGRAATAIGALDVAPAWPGSRLLLRLDDFTPGNRAEVVLDGRRLLIVPIGAGGRARATLRIPPGTHPGVLRLDVRDVGGGTQADPRAVDVLDEGDDEVLPEAPVLWAGPSPTRGRVLIAGAAFPPHARAALLLEVVGEAPRRIGDVVTRGNGRLWVVAGLPRAGLDGRVRITATTVEGPSASASVRLSPQG
jgi:hypothetical protein